MALNQIINQAVPAITSGLTYMITNGFRSAARVAVPRATVAVAEEYGHGYDDRQHVRSLAEAEFDVFGTFTEEQRASLGLDIVDPYEKLGKSPDDLTEEECRFLGVEFPSSPPPRTVRVYYHNIRAIRNTFDTDAMDSPLPFLSHWSLEVDGVFYELRANPREGSARRANDDGRIILHEEAGSRDREIKLEITTNRRPLQKAKYIDVGRTRMTTEQIIQTSSILFRKFGDGYDCWMDNCQLFTQLLAEAICGRKNVKEVRRLLESKSIILLSVVGSWLAAPAYYTTAMVQHAFQGKYIDNVLEDWDKFQHHPNVYRQRKEAYERLESIAKQLNPFD